MHGQSPRSLYVEFVDMGEVYLWLKFLGVRDKQTVRQWQLRSDNQYKLL
jgi:hypothetical protein